MPKIRVAIAGGSGYTGGELLRLLLFHPEVEVAQVSSESEAGQPVVRTHPNLRKSTGLTYCPLSDLAPCDALFLCLPHGETMGRVQALAGLAERVIDLSADFRLKNPEDYERWYRTKHPCPDRLAEFVYGLPELHRDELRTARLVSSGGCNATVAILALHPLVKHGLAGGPGIVVEVKAGSSESGRRPTESSHHPERSRCLRSYRPTGHRHAAEIVQELRLEGRLPLHFSATAVDLVRGILATAHVFPDRAVSEKEIWTAYRTEYGLEPFIRIVKERSGPYRYPEPKIVMGTNFCDIGFEADEAGRRIVVMAAIDNLMKGAAGQAVQAFNIMHGFDERAGLEFPGLHPV